MPNDHRARLASISRFDQLVAYLRDEMGWPIDSDDFEELTFEYTPEELGIDAKNAAKIQKIKRLRKLVPSQPWGIFFVKFEPKRVQSGVLRSVLGRVVLKKRASAHSAERQAWAADDLLFISAFGDDDERRMVFAHFSQPTQREDLPVLKVVDWDDLDTGLHLDDVARKLTTSLAWPDDTSAVKEWRERWQSAFELRPRQSISTSKQLSIRLAELARAIRDRILTTLDIETERGPLTSLMKAFQEVLVHDLDVGGFADMYAQTIAYGLLSARIADPDRKSADDLASQMRTNPFLRELMETFLRVGGRRGKAGGPGIDFDELGVTEVVELLDNANMEAVLRDFGDRNPQEDPVIHFYEHFLSAYDREQKVKRGVFYTPRPVVSYIVRSVDELLRTEFGLVDGLADTTTWGEMAKRHKNLTVPEGVSPDQAFVQILDPAAGTGTFLVEVIDTIYRTMGVKWEREAGGPAFADVLGRWNDYVPKQLLPRLHGYELLMAPYAIAHLKIGLKLFETGYRFGADERARVYLTNALEPARDEQPTLDFLPALAHEAQSVNEIKRRQRFTVVLGNPPYATISQNMSPWIRHQVDSYLEVDTGRMKEKGNRNHLQDDYVKFFRLGHCLIDTSGVGILGLITNDSYLGGSWHRGMRYQLSRAFHHVNVVELNGGVGFSLSYGDRDENVFDIMKSVCISLLTRRPQPLARCDVLWSSLIGPRDYKYEQLSQGRPFEGVRLDPQPHNQWAFVPVEEKNVGEWSSFVELPDLFRNWGEAATTNRDGLALGMTRTEVLKKARDFGDLSISDMELESRYSFGSNYQWKTCRARARFVKSPFQDLSERYLRRPFDNQFVYWHPDIVYNMRGGKLETLRGSHSNKALLFSRATTKSRYTNFFVTDCIPDKQCVYNCKVAPLFTETGGMFPESQTNLSERALAAARRLVSSDMDTDDLSEAFFNYVYAMAYSEAYRTAYADQLQRDYPRFPLQAPKDLFESLRLKGGELIALHLFRTSKLDEPITSFVSAGRFPVEKVSYDNETVWTDKLKTTGFRGVPDGVWNFHIGGYQVCEKWLKDRKGRTLSKDDIVHYQKIVVALNETIRIMAEIDEVIERHGGWPGAFQTGATGTAEERSLLKVAEPSATYDAGTGREKRPT